MDVKHLNYDKAVDLEGKTLRRYQLELLKILKDIVSVCTEKGFFYQLCGGTALGAVRNSGFIPWDDDVDIVMLNNQFDCFVNCFKEKYQDKYWIHTCHTEGYGLAVNKIRLKGSVARLHEDINNPEAGFFVDIFLYENTFDNVILRKLHGLLCLSCGMLLSCRKYYSNKALMYEIASKDKKALRSAKIRCLLGFFIQFISLREWAEITQRCYALCKNNDSKYICIPSGKKHYFGEMYERSKIMTSIRVPFENEFFNVTNDYDTYFKVLYGDDYMVPAVQGSREKHLLLELVFPDSGIEQGF